MVFSSNPLSLSVPDPAFETWLRDNHYLEVLDRNSAALNHRKTTTPSATTTTAAATATSILNKLTSHLLTLISLFTLNPFSKLTNEDFSAPTPSWTAGFVGFSDSYSLPSSPEQAKLRVHENVKRYCRNYSCLFLVYFACSLYQLPVALIGLLSSLTLWELFRFYSDRWSLDSYPIIRQSLVRLAQIAAALIIMFSNVVMAFIYAVLVTYAAIILHSSCRKLTPIKQPTNGR